MNRLRCWIARVNLPDAEPWLVIVAVGASGVSRRGSRLRLLVWSGSGDLV